MTSDPDTISILITSDNHVGYKESDPIRGDDSWITFEEITQIARTNDVDMILHGGDLFHVSKPSKKSMYYTIKSLRTNCMGDRPCEIELLSDPNAINKDGTVNYEDPNLNISIPVFAISGNHDDATGAHMLSPLDVLSMSGLVNHFGKVFDNNRLVINPILLRKGSTQLALYGMQSIKDERLHRLFRDGQVKFLRPSLQTDSWFNLMCVHQNHFAHTKTSYLPESFLPKFLDFVVWGHEHECIPKPVTNEKGFHTLRVGSSIATSLSDGEVPQKHVFILRVKQKSFDLEAVPLKTVRPFFMEVIDLEEEGFDSSSGAKEIKQLLLDKVESLIQQAHDQYMKDIDEDGLERLEKDMKLPLIRLKVDYTGDFELDSPQRLSKQFIGRVANIDDIFLFTKRKIKKQSEKIETKEIELSPKVTISSLIANLDQSNLSLLSDVGLNEAVKKAMDKEDKSILKDYIMKEIKFHAKTLNSVDIEEGDPKQVFKQLLSRFKQESKIIDTEALDSEAIDIETVKEPSKSKVKDSTRKPRTSKKVSKKYIEVEDSDEDMGNVSEESVIEEDGVRSDDGIVSDEGIVSDSDGMVNSEEDEPEPPKPTRGRGRGRARGTRGTTRGSTRGTTRGARGARGKTTKTKDTSNDLLSTLANMGK